MRIISLYLNIVIASIFICFSNGAPPKNVPYNRFSDQERKLLLTMLEHHVQTGVYIPSIWKEIEKAHEEKVKAKATGFAAYRNIKALQHHFFYIMRYDKASVSDGLRELYEHMKKAITCQEQDFINQELLHSDNESWGLLGDKRWIDIQKKHEEKRKSGELGFAYRRTWRTLRNYFQVMIPKNLVWEAVKEKFPDYFQSDQDLSPFEDLLNPLDASSSEKSLNRFSNQEHELIFKMLESQAGAYKPSVWLDIMKAYEEKLKAHADGFVKRRSKKSLQQYFLNTLKNDKVKVSNALREVYEQMKRMAITRQEQDLINRELLQSGDDSLSLLSDKRWIDIQKKHEENRKSGKPGFANKRSWPTLRKHFRGEMKPRNLVWEPVKQKFPVFFENEQDATIEDLLSEIDGNLSEIKFTRYSDQEHKLLFKMLEEQAQTGEYKSTVWRKIEKAFEEKRTAKVNGFSKHRNIKSLRQTFLISVRSNKVQVSESLRKLYQQMKRIGITRQERDLINRELSRSDLPDWSLTENARWKKIQEKHDEKRESGTPGFENQRSGFTLRNHFNKVMKPKNLVDEAVKKRFPRDFQNNQGGTSYKGVEESDTNPDDMECNSNEEHEIWDPILENLENSQRGPVKSNNQQKCNFN